MSPGPSLCLPLKAFLPPKKLFSHKHHGKTTSHPEMRKIMVHCAERAPAEQLRTGSLQPTWVHLLHWDPSQAQAWLSQRQNSSWRRAGDGPPEAS